MTTTLEQATEILGTYREGVRFIKVDEVQGLKDDGTISGGMIPKVDCCLEAVEKGVGHVHILDGRIMHCMLLEIFTNKGIGTAIIGDQENRYYSGS